MNLASIFQQLSYGHLSELAIGGTGSGSIPVAHIPKLTHRVDQALVALYTRFPLRIRALEIETVDGLFQYPLRVRHAQTSGIVEPVKFIKDSLANQFTGDVLKVHAIYDRQDKDRELPLNRRNDELSWFTSTFDTLQMGYPVTGNRYSVEYRARHDALEINPADPAAVEVAIPTELVPALLAHVAGNVYGGMSMEGATAKGQALLAEFENQCSMHEATNTWDQHHEPFRDPIKVGGWV